MPIPFDLEKFLFLPVKAMVREFDATEETVKVAILAAIDKASTTETAGVTDPIGSNGKPRMLQLSGWITYADEVNLNARMFTPTDLAEAVAGGMFKAPFFGMIDYNHDFSSYGVWYDAKYMYDEQAGKWGIYAEGVIFAWRYNELADKMLAMQARQGHIDLSMACLAAYYEPARTAAGMDYLVARKPVFFTTSVLDVDPAFPNARAHGTESPDSTPEQRADALLKTGLGNKATETASMTPEDIAAATAETARVEAERAAEVAAAETARLAAEAIKATDLEEVPTAPAAPVLPEVPVVEVATLTAKVAELSTLLATATVALEAAKTQIETLVAEGDALRSFKAEVDAARLATVVAETSKARLSEIPETIRVEMAKEENAVLLAEWMVMDAEKWETTKRVFSVASAGRLTLAERSALEGILPGTSEGAEGKYAISKHIRSGAR